MELEKTSIVPQVLCGGVPNGAALAGSCDGGDSGTNDMSGVQSSETKPSGIGADFKTLSRHSSHYLVGRVVVMLLGIASFSIFTRFFSVAEYGIMSLILKVVGLAIVFAKLGFQTSAIRFYEEHNQQNASGQLRQYYSTLFFGPLAFAAVVTAICVLAIKLAPDSMISLDLKKLLILASALILVRAMWSVLMAFLRVESRTKTQNVLEVIIKAATVVLVCLLFFVWKHLSLWSFFTVSIAVETVLALGITAYLMRQHLLAVRGMSLELFKTVLFFGLPFMLVEFSSIILDSGDRVLVQHYLGAVALGYYSAAYNMSSQLQESLLASINLAFFPICMKLWATRGREETQAFISRSLNIFLIIAAGAYCITSSTSSDAMIVLASKKFAEAHRLLPILIAGLMVSSVRVFLTASLLIYKKTFVIAQQVIWSCILNIVLNVILLPRMGIMGAAIATLISYAFLVVLVARVSFAFIPLRIEYWTAIKCTAAALAVSVLISRFPAGNPYLGLVTKGSLSVILYISAVAVVAPEVRSFLLTLVRSRMSRTGKQHVVLSLIPRVSPNSITHPSDEVLEQNTVL